MRLKISDDFSLPIEAATQTFLIVGKRGSGKSNSAARLAEQFFTAGVPFVVVDPVDNWSGLKSSRDGKAPGLSVYVFGGKHADLPLEPSAGALIADTLVEHRISAVLSIKHLSGRERGRFVGDLAHRLFQRNTEPLHVFLEEAHEVAPQQPFKGEEEMLGHVSRLWKLGRSSGLGGSAISQRPASLSKNVTTQAEILIVHRMIGPQDVAAIREWIKYHGEREDILAELSTLKTGEAFIWAPDFPEGRPIGLKRVTMLQRETYDSAATPKAGEHRAEPKALAPVDMERLRTKMAATIEKAKAEDPRELQRQVRELKAQLAKAPAVQAPEDRRVRVKVREVKVKILSEPLVRRLENAVKRLATHDVRSEETLRRALDSRQRVEGAVRALEDRLWTVITPEDKLLAALRPHLESLSDSEIESAIGKMDRILAGLRSPASTPPQAITGDRMPSRAIAPPRPTSAHRPPAALTEGLTGPQQAILDTVAMLGVRGLTPDRDMVARWLGLHPRGGTHNTNLALLRSGGYLDGLLLTAKGVESARLTDTGLDAALATLNGEPKRAIIRALIDAGKPLSREELAERLGLHPRGGTHNTNLSRLRAMGLITERGPITTTDGLFR